MQQKQSEVATIKAKRHALEKTLETEQAEEV